MVPPEYAAVSDLPESSFVARRSLSTFPLSHLEGAFGIKVLEPRYIQHATSHLLGRSVLNGREERRDRLWRDLPKREKARKLHTAIALTRVSDIGPLPHLAVMLPPNLLTRLVRSRR